ncbi:hypothetical protein KVR01_000172 [Diaporthe batatas]|uniref:uncharacterized protein n=1 Tax=Diaporthe batatas TaxID=748121 RepID=UPI001D046A1B|nr:uncharacterized protein KVR01_000172 [Diaporthe batatas]KAG8169427.1 hypothetical protein KVR01_000172 [Diaporthe batatas]
MAATTGSRPGSTGSAPAHHPSLPASPTLTNPDMILPDYPDYDRSPSPVRLDSNRPQSPLTMWRNAQAAGAPNDHNINNMLYNQATHHFAGFASAAPATPIIYGNGTMLSDIGEVTEAESTPGKPSPPRHVPVRVSPHGTMDRDSESDAALRSSPTMGQGGSLSAIKKKAKEQAAAQRDRRSSTGSDSTVTDHHDQANLFADFSDAISVGGDSVFQGDDEESMASSYVDDSDVNGASDVHGVVPVSLSYESRQKYSTAQLSRRAEHILANAKRRLTTMEDNLTRARSSLAVATYSSGSNGSTPSPPIARATSALYMSTMSSSSPSSPAFSGHSRKSSDHSLRIGLPIKVYPQRSSSIIGLPTSARQPLTVSKSADQLNGQYKRASYIVREAQVPLEPLSEDEASQLSSRAHPDATYRHSSITSPTFGGGAERGLARSASVTQMRDIKDQVNDLKGKISSLREQARADSLKRRSMQSLRTPSPFTYSRVGQWSGVSDSTTGSDTKSDADPDKPGHLSDETASIGKDSAVNIGDLGDGDGGSIYSVEDIQHLGHAQVEQLDRDSEAALRAEGFVHVDDDDDDNDDNDDDMFTENGDIDEDELEEVFDSVSEGGDSLYHEAVQHQVSHEDREDAFDYEHLFLHSAMGTISQRMARRNSNASYTSESSIETTRGPIIENKQRRPQHSRRGSEASVSSVESFATAEEALSSRQSMDSSRNADALGDLPEESSTPSTPSTPSTETMDSPQTAKRATFTGITSSYYGISGRPSPEGQTRREVMYSTIRRPVSSNAATKTHRPSTSSFDSTGTTRSFPLVNRSSKTFSTGMLTPEGGSPDQAVRSITTSLMSDTTAACREMQNGETTDKSPPAYGGHKHSISMQSISSTASLMQENGTTAVIETLPRDDQFLVERTVASLGRCVLGLTDSGRAGVEGRMYRRRIDAARRILEGIDES